jgi:hypothetical protein
MNNNDYERSYYYKLEKIKYKLLRLKNDKYYPIVNPTVIRRDYSYRDDKIIQQSIVLDLEGIILLSKIHIKPCYPKIIKIQIGIDLKNLITIEDELEVVGGKLRIVNVGSLPIRFLKMTFLKGCPIMDYKTVELFGIHPQDIQHKYTKEIEDIMFSNTYGFLYNYLERMKLSKNQKI